MTRPPSVRARYVRTAAIARSTRAMHRDSDLTYRRELAYGSVPPWAAELTDLGAALRQPIDCTTLRLPRPGTWDHSP